MDNFTFYFTNEYHTAGRENDEHEWKVGVGLVGAGCERTKLVIS